MISRTRSADEIHAEICAALGPQMAGRVEMALEALRTSTRWYAVGADFRLSPREIQVAKLICAGYCTGEIALALKITQGTAKTHVTRICHKTSVRRRERLPIKLLLAAGLIQTQKGDL